MFFQDKKKWFLSLCVSIFSGLAPFSCQKPLTKTVYSSRYICKLMLHNDRLFIWCEERGRGRRNRNHFAICFLPSE